MILLDPLLYLWNFDIIVATAESKGSSICFVHARGDSRRRSQAPRIMLRLRAVVSGSNGSHIETTASDAASFL
jgi:hypothetical protein